MLSKYYLLIFSLLFVLTSCDDSDNIVDDPEPDPEEEPGTFDVVRVFPNLTFAQPVLLTNAGDGSDRLFVVERAGRIVVFANNEQTAQAQTFLDIRQRVNSNGSERGLLGLAFHPNFNDNGYFYVYYTGFNNGQTVVSRFSVNGSVGDSSSESVILEVAQPFANHNAGTIEFGPDNYLYIALGDGGGGGDPIGAGQDATTLLGSILRIDVDNPSNGLAYGIPADNPFVGNVNQMREEIFAYGLRNPFRFSFDRENGNLWAGDVGQDRIEEIDLIESGQNYGWNTMEGTLCFGSTICDQTGLTLPVVEYTHSIGMSVTGGYVYRGDNFPELQGYYFYADFVTRVLFRFDTNDSEPQQEQFLNLSIGVSSFGEDEAGELYLVDFLEGGIHTFVEQ